MCGVKVRNKNNVIGDTGKISEQFKENRKACERGVKWVRGKENGDVSKC